MARPVFALTLKLIVVGVVGWSVLLYSSSQQDGRPGLLEAGDLLTNPGFELVANGRPQGWSNFDGTLSASSAYVHSGSYAAVFESASTTAKWLYQVVPVSSGSYYTLSGHIVKDDVNISKVELRVRWFASLDGTGSAIVPEYPPVALTANEPSYVPLSTGRIMAPSGARSASVRVIVVPASGSFARILVDDLSLFEEAPANSATATPTLTATPTSTPSPVPPATLSGSVRLQARGPVPGDKWMVPIAIALHSPGATTPARLFNTRTDSSGRFTVTGFSPSTYDVRLSKDRALAVKRNGVTLVSGDNILDLGVLLEGDANGDGIVNGLDYSPLASAYMKIENEPGFNPSVDFNDDGRISAVDYALLAGNYLQVGDRSQSVQAMMPARRPAAVFAPKRYSPLQEGTITATATRSPTPTPTASATPIVAASATHSATAMATPSATASATHSVTASATHSATAPAASSATAPATPSPTASATPPIVTTGEVLVSEVQYDPAPSGVDSDFEWFELYNTSNRSISLEWLKVSDNSSTSALPGYSLLPGKHVVVAATAEFLSLFPDFSGAVVYMDGGRIGNGLSNTGDRLVIRNQAGQVVDAMSYGTDKSIFDPSCPTVSAGQTLERVAMVDSDMAADFARSSSPSPGRGPNATPTPSRTATAAPTLSPAATSTPTTIPASYAEGIWLNEILPAPKDVDWNGDGTSDSDDEWIELYNEGDADASIAGWLLGDATAKRFSFPAGTTLPGRGFTVVYGKQTGLSLNNSGDTVKLMHPDGSLADSVQFGSMAYNVSYARVPDGTGAWRKLSSPSPGDANTVQASQSSQSTDTSDPASPLDQVRDRLVSIAHARVVPSRTKVYLRAQVTADPNLLGSRRMYIQDETGSLAVYLQRGAYPRLQTGDWVLFTGIVGERRGEKELQVYWAVDAVFLGRGEAPEPVAIGLHEVGEAFESRLVLVTGTVGARTASSLELGDGSSSARVYVRPDTRIDTAQFPRGSDISVVGIVSQYDSQPPYDAGFRLLPRSPADISVQASETELAPAPDAAGDTASTADDVPTVTPVEVVARPTRLPRTGDSLLSWLLLAGAATTGAGLALRLAAGSPPQKF